jgi:hypothetical protein
MDSLYRVEVYDAPAYDMPAIDVTVCQNELPYDFNGELIRRAGSFTFTKKTREGCDSIVRINLTVNPSYHFITDTTIVDYEYVIWRGEIYNQAGVYDYSEPTVLNCDSTYTLQLHVIHTQRDTIYKTICAGDSYYWRGRTLSNDGFYSDTVRSVEGNYSAIYSLRLTVAYPTTIISAKTGDICADAEEVEIEFEYDGAKPTRYSIYFDALAKREGFKDAVDSTFGPDMIARVTIQPSQADVLYNGHTTYVRPDNYTMRLVLDNGICGKSESTDLKFQVKYPSWIIEQNWDDVVAPLKPELNGGYEFSQITWTINGAPQPNTGLGYLHNDHLQVGDEVVMWATRKGENYAIPTCPLPIVAPTMVYDNPIIVTPNGAPRHAPKVTIVAPCDGIYEVFTSTGHQITSGNFSEGDTQVTLPMISGIYFIRTIHGEESETHKVIIY